MMKHVLHAGLAAAVGLTALSACGDATPSGAEGKQVVAGFYPLQFLAERVGGERVKVTNLAQPGAEPHDLELKPSQVIEVDTAPLVLYLKGFQPELDKAVAQKSSGKAFDVATVAPLAELKDDHGHEDEETKKGEDEHGGLDPHVWLDPSRYATLAEATGKQLAEIDPANAAEYTARAAALKTELTKLDEEFATGLKTCQRREIITSHAAFGYLAQRYNLDQIPITGLTPESEPTPQRLAQVKAEAEGYAATTIFFETLVSPKVAETLAREVGAKTAVLDPLEGLEAGSNEDYFSVMRTNLGTLREALGCS